MLFETSQNQHYIPKYGLVPESISTPAAKYKHSDSHLFVQFPDKEKILQLCTSLLHLFKHGINLDTPSYMCDVMEYLVSFPGFPRLSFSPLFRFRLFYWMQTEEQKREAWERDYRVSLFTYALCPQY